MFDQKGRHHTRPQRLQLRISIRISGDHVQKDCTRLVSILVGGEVHTLIDRKGRHHTRPQRLQPRVDIDSDLVRSYNGGSSSFVDFVRKITGDHLAYKCVRFEEEGRKGRVRSVQMFGRFGRFSGRDQSIRPSSAIHAQPNRNLPSSVSISAPVRFDLDQRRNIQNPIQLAKHAQAPMGAIKNRHKCQVQISAGFFSPTQDTTLSVTRHEGSEPPRIVGH